MIDRLLNDLPESLSTHIVELAGECGCVLVPMTLLKFHSIFPSSSTELTIADVNFGCQSFAEVFVNFNSTIFLEV